MVTQKTESCCPLFVLGSEKYFPNIDSNIFVFVFDCLQNWDRYQNCEKQENYFDKKIQKTHATEHFRKQDQIDQ